MDIYREDQPNEVHRVYAIVDDQCMRENMCRSWVGARIWGMDHYKQGICSFVKKVGTPERSRLIERYMQTYWTEIENDLD